MSLQGEIETRCPGGCEPFSTPVWSFVHGGKNPELRDTIKALELNLLLCPSCGKAFPPEAMWIYYEPALEILAFVFPESFKADEAKWRSKMEEDYAVLREALDSELPVSHPPDIFFGPQGLADLLEFEDFRSEERDVMEYYAREQGLSLYKADPAWAREQGVPNVLPYTGKAATRESLIAGSKSLLAANDRLTAWDEYRKMLEADPSAAPPPPAKG
jgi:hypothetical protein